jgi:hypothetical protein
MLLRKPLFIATFATVVAAAALSPKAQAADPLLGALIGGGIGAAIGHDVNGRHGTAAGAAIGAVLGSAIAADSNRYSYGDRYYGDRYYDDRYYYAPAPAPVYYGPAYYPAPAYYGPTVTYTYSSYPRHYSRPYRHWDGHRHWR